MDLLFNLKLILTLGLKRWLVKKMVPLWHFLLLFSIYLTKPKFCYDDFGDYRILYVHVCVCENLTINAISLIRFCQTSPQYIDITLIFYLNRSKNA